MEGDTTSEEHQGVIPRAIRDIFQRLNSERYIESSVKVTYLEIYNEELGDLLLDQNNAALTSPSKKAAASTSKLNKRMSISDRSGGLGSSSSSSSSGLSGSSAPPKLTIVEDKKKNGRGVHCHGLNEVEVDSVEDVLSILEQVKSNTCLSLSLFVFSRTDFFPFLQVYMCIYMLIRNVKQFSFLFFF
jgi:hypothetical protein